MLRFEWRSEAEVQGRGYVGQVGYEVSEGHKEREIRHEECEVFSPPECQPWKEEEKRPMGDIAGELWAMSSAPIQTAGVAFQPAGELPVSQ